MFKRFCLFAFVVLLASGCGTDQIPPIYKGDLPFDSEKRSQKFVESIEDMSDELGLDVPEGFSIAVFARDLGTPRVMTHDPDGNLVVSVTKSGEVVALPDKDLDLKADEKVTILDGLFNAHGLLFICEDEDCKLYVAETDKVVVYDYKNMQATNPRKIIDLPGAGGHFTRTLHVRDTEEGRKLLVSVGSSCNVCNESDWRRASVLVSDMDGSNLETYTDGLRNAVFMATHFVTGDLWVTEMGRDWLGDDLPPDEINIIEEGEHYGWPNCYGDKVYDSNFGAENICADTVGTHIDVLPAHSAPLGLDFIPEEGWDESYWYDLIVAMHGSWNRSEPSGYKLMRYRLDENGRYLGEENFITGFLDERGRVLGRPVDVMIKPGGLMYVTDDKAGVVYVLISNDGVVSE